MRVGLVSDTHGRFDAALPGLFQGCDLVVHAGDVVGQEILHQLGAIAPVEAVRGNCDTGALGAGLQEQRVLRLDGLTALVVHDARNADQAVASAIAQLVIHGHSHVPGAGLKGGVLFVNPGSAGTRRCNLPRSAGRLTVHGRRVQVELLDLEARGMPLAEPAEFAL